MLYLTSDRLRVEIALPGERPNSGFRFDRTGFISDVTLDGSMHFCAAEPRNMSNPSALGRGLCDEIRFDTVPETEDGALFPKFGIGLFKKPAGAEKYVFFHKYDVAEEYPVHYETEGSSKITFATEPIECNGYAIRTKKTISVEDNKLTMTLNIENTGSKSITMNEFCHNFLSIDGMALGSDYTLEFPQLKNDIPPVRQPNRDGGMSCFRGYGKGLQICEYNPTGSLVAFTADKIGDTVPFTWKLTHLGAKAYVEVEESVKPSWIVIWACDHMICPEVIHEFTLNPGESEEWTRSWTFEQEL